MSANTKTGSFLETFISMMAWFVNLMYKRWRYSILARCIHTMASGAFGFKAALPALSIL
jgi:hypothetical protein